VILPAHSAVTLAVIVAVLLIKRPEKLKAMYGITEESHDGAHKNSRPLFKMLGSNPTFIWLLIAIIFTFMSSGTLEIFLINILTSVGGTTVDLGAALFVMAAAEISTMFLFSLIIKRFHSNMLLKLSIIAFLGKSLLLMFAVNPTMVVATHAIYIAANGLFVPASFYLINEIVKKNELPAVRHWVPLLLSAAV
jgi:PPP family 3-phenylpropionic acid transporter